MGIGKMKKCIARNKLSSNYSNVLMLIPHCLYLQFGHQVDKFGLNLIFHITNKPRNNGGIFVTNTRIITKLQQQFTKINIEKNLDRAMDIQGSGEQFLSDIR